MSRLVALQRTVFLLLLLGIGLGIVTAKTMRQTEREVEKVNTALANCALAERSLQLDLRNQRAGLLRNYDMINAHLDQARECRNVLAHASLGGTARETLEILEAKNIEQEELVHQFNTSNALLQTALLYFTYHMATTVDEQRAINHVLKLTLDTSLETVDEAYEAIQQISPSSQNVSTPRSLSYAHLLIEILPEMDRLIALIQDIDVENAISDLRLAVQEDFLSRSRQVQRLQIALAATIILFSIAGTTFLAAQRHHTLALQAQAENAQLSAAIAVPLIDTGPGTFHSRVQEAAERLARHVGARRLQLAVPGVDTCTLSSSPGASLDPNWLWKLDAAAETDQRWIDDQVLASRSTDGADGSLARAMNEAGVNQLILLRTSEPFRVTIGFEPENFDTAQRSDNLAGLSAAMVAIAHSARREVLQTERERLEMAVAEKRRLANLGVIASGVAHNFNNITGAISGFAEIGQRRATPESVIHKSFDEILDAAERAGELVEAILNYARQRLSARKTLDLGDLLKQTVRMLSVSPQNGAEFQLITPDEGFFVYAAKSDLQQVLLNICNNAADAGQGKPVQLSVERRQLTEKQEMSHDTLYPGKFAVISITDAGPGIPEDMLSRLFEPFFTSKSNGTGLGLSTAWEIMKMHGGTIHVENIAQKGACFSIWLPEVTTDASGAIAGRGARILLIAEPNRLVAEEDMLAELGYEPVGVPLNADIKKMSELVQCADAVLIATWQISHANEIVLGIASALEGRPLLLATMADVGWSRSVPVVPLTYPLRADQVSSHLSLVLAGDQSCQRAPEAIEEQV